VIPRGTVLICKAGIFLSVYCLLTLGYSKRLIRIKDMTEVATNVPDVKKRGRPRKVIVPQEPEEPEEPQEPPEPQEPALETIQEDKEKPPPKEPPTPVRRRVKKPSQPVRMKTAVHPTARDIAGELAPVMMRHLEDRHFSRQEQRRALYSSWL
jgi:type IV secretory pathway VirB10-like protein